ncbi:uroporphyrinogen-III synthase [Metabacillus iocasae]|uniref:Uroporphyrinogen-III synthase n=1 Tax=Priestia iocasae TaxID=2291674 RepID=A0ABS2QPG0_9BACI|nr:uroporphyrinogen-III synthase [Metabacillus iocasae]MBM7701338.1 uroporphyrinogen-III synthase [Metabacillus iocasae]
MSHRAPLFLKNILITRASRQAHSFSKRIEDLGGTPVHIPLLTFTRAKTNRRQVKEVLQTLHTYDWIVFTSQNGISFFMEWLKDYQIKQDELNKLKVAVVGEKTAKELEKHGVKVTVMPEKFVAEALLDSLLREVHKNEKVLLVRGNLARPVIREGLIKEGYHVTDLIVYETVRSESKQEELVQLLKERKIHAVTFTSSSTVDSFVEAMKNIPNWLELLNDCLIVCIGPITSTTASEYGLKHHTPNEYTVDGMIELLVSCFSRSEN